MTEAEFISMAYCVREVSWIHVTLVELVIKQVDPTVMNEDNVGSIYRMNDVPGLQKLMHIVISYHFVR